MLMYIHVFLSVFYFILFLFYYEKIDFLNKKNFVCKKF
jgi:hypothetical protein